MGHNERAESIPAVRVDQVWARHPDGDVFALRDLSFRLEPGESVAVVGESGAGKSTLVAALAGFIGPERGTVEIGGTPLLPGGRSLRAARRRLGLVLQLPRPSLDPTQKVIHAVAEPLVHLSGCPWGKALTQAGDLLARLGIGREMHGRRPAALSGGQCQRVAVARALVHSPPVLLADEATASLDAETGEALLEEAVGLARDRKQAVVWVTHRLDEAERLCGKTMVLLAGVAVERVEAFRTWNQVLHPYSRHLAAARKGPVAQFATALTGCPFQAGCPLAEEACGADMPRESEVAPGHFVRCVRGEQLAQGQ
ncbi:MAG: ABC transporter ATP-binding protein [Deltaproteobacteria bacterium]|nr:ABC transporter ATP-binding protein [Deltaproteobacteria bacterium]